MTNPLWKKLCMGVVGVSIFLGTVAMPQEMQSTSQSPTSPGSIIRNTINRMESGAKRHVKKLYLSLIGDETCSAHEVILTRLLAFIITIECIHNFSLWLIRIKMARILRQLKFERLEELKKNKDTIPTKNNKEEVEEPKCCVCWGEENELFPIPCRKEYLKHPATICFNCAVILRTSGLPCPMCRGALIS